MGRRIVALPLNDEQGPRLGGSSSQVRIYDDKDLTTLSTVYSLETGGVTLPNPLTPTSEFQSDATVAILSTDTVITVRDVSGFAAGQRVPIYDGTNTKYRFITAINAGLKQLTISESCGVGFAVGPTFVGHPAVVGDTAGWVDDTIDHFLQVKDVASTFVMPFLSVATRVPTASINVREEGVLAGTRGTLNFIGVDLVAKDNAGADRVDIYYTRTSLWVAGVL